MMVMQTPKMNNAINCLEKANSEEKMQNPSFPQSDELSALMPGLIEEFINGMLILTDHRELLYADSSAKRIIRLLNQDKQQANLVPKEIWHICQYLIYSRNLFPNQYWISESDIIIENSIALHIRAKWIDLENIDNPCLLIIVEDRYQAMRNIALEQAQKYGLTRREKEVWLLHRENYTYKQIASELCITPNTVKKHMKSIQAKQREQVDSIE